MSTIYTSFGFFMKEAVVKAERIDNFGKSNVFEILIKIMTHINWKGFLCLCALLTLGAWAFSISLLAFMATPIGMTVAVVLGLAAATSIKTLYKNRIIPLAIKEVGNQFHHRYDDLKKKQDKQAIDGLVTICAKEIVKEAKKQINKSTWFAKMG